jgi:hypothetical protein
MTDRIATRPVLGAQVAANIRAELARAGISATEARDQLRMGETAWKTRQTNPGRWTLGELLALQRITGVPLSDLVTPR